MAYVISGFFAGLAAIAYACTFTSITPGTGAGLELDESNFGNGGR